MKNISFRIDEKLLSELEKVEKEFDLSRSYLVRKGIELVIRDAKKGGIDGNLAPKSKK